ncbi:YciI family protein [Spongisporangium articulatum]|uniref:YciI family protein n=1 Tax=Spongisporangium articulatum TaxID=3362603 RepID=A0ABW8AMN7_9ACTN
MQFLTMIHAREDQTPPTPEMYEAMGELIEKFAAEGVFLSGGGLLPSSEGATIAVRGGEVIVSDGPYAEATEVVGGWAVIEADSLQHVVDLSRQTLDLHLKYMPGWEGYSEIRQIAG